MPASQEGRKMRVRRPRFDFSATPVQWTSNPEFAQSMNASSSFIPHLERFLNRVMEKARAEIVGDDAASVELRTQIDTFIKQEANHYTMHAAFNKILPRNGYTKVPEFETKMAAEFAEFLRTRSAGFLYAYCEGFETLGPPSALVWLDEIEDMLVGADPNAVGLWKWHLMEEYEHRTVCHDVFQRLHGGYFLRIYGLLFQLHHLTSYSTRVRRYLLAMDRNTMNAVEIKASRRREKSAARRIRRLMLPRLLRALSPFYTPRNAREPKMFKAYMATVESRLR
jgi:uncharacterized protein